MSLRVKPTVALAHVLARAIALTLTLALTLALTLTLILSRCRLLRSPSAGLGSYGHRVIGSTLPLKGLTYP